MARRPQEWGGDVRLPGWLRRPLRRPSPPGDTPERARIADGSGPSPERVDGGGRVDSVLGHAALTDLDYERRK